MTIKDITPEELEDNIGEGITVVDCWAAWCRPCVKIGDEMKRLEEEDNLPFNVMKIDIETHRAFAMEYGVRGIPAFLIFKDGELVTQFSGSTSGEMFVERVKSLAAGLPDPHPLGR